MHERVNGGPDRRYNYNPSTLVYDYATLNRTLNGNCKLIHSNSSLAHTLVNSICNYKTILTPNPISVRRGIEDIDVSKDEVASLFKEIISKYGQRGKNNSVTATVKAKLNGLVIFISRRAAGKWRINTLSHFVCLPHVGGIKDFSFLIYTFAENHTHFL